MTRPMCHAGRDGDCFWADCPQEIVYRSNCLLDNLCPDCGGDEDAPACKTCRGEGFVEVAPSVLRLLAEERATQRRSTER